MKEVSVEGFLSVAKGIGYGVYSLFNQSIEYVPYLGRFIHAVKFNRLERRMQENSVQLQRISKVFQSSVLSEEYISQRIFPIVLADLIEEHEEAKINLLLTGFENVFIEEQEDESIVINYFDVLRNLRYKDIKRFMFLAGIVTDYPEVSSHSEEEDFVWSIDHKLQRMGLIVQRNLIDEIIGQNTGIRRRLLMQEAAPLRRSDAEITRFGNRFLRFITLSEEKVADS